MRREPPHSRLQRTHSAAKERVWLAEERAVFSLATARVLCWSFAAAVLLAAPTHAVVATAVPAPAAAPPPAALTLAGIYQPGVDVTLYWVSEKYDGVRGHWDGQQLRSRQGLRIASPAWFTAGWPAVPMDGELWAGRGQFAAAQAAVAQAQPSDAAWRKLRYMVFDLPAQPGGFGQRLPQLQSTVAALNKPWVQAVPQWRVANHPELMAQLARLEKQGAEGLMLRRDDAPYRGGRGDDLLKLKSHQDAEAVVVAHLPGKGRYMGQTGALLVQMPSGQQFRLGSGLSDTQRLQPPPVGATVTYRYTGMHASGLPRFARFWRVRADVPPEATPASAQSPPCPCPCQCKCQRLPLLLCLCLRWLRLLRATPRHADRAHGFQA